MNNMKESDKSHTGKSRSIAVAVILLIGAVTAGLVFGIRERGRR